MATDTANRRIARNALFLYLRMFVMLGIGIYTGRVVIQALGASDYGTQSLVSGLITLFTFLHATMTAATGRYFTFYMGQADEEKLKDSFNIALRIHLLIALIVAILGETLGLWLFYQLDIPATRVEAAFWLYQLSIVATSVIIASYPYQAAIVASERMHAFAYISLLDAALKLGFALLIVVIPFDKLIYVGLYTLFIQTLDRIIYHRYCLRHFSFCRIARVRSKRLVKEMVQFAGWNTVGTLTIPLYQQGIAVMLNLVFHTTLLNAAHGIATKIQAYSDLFVHNVQVAINPQITKSYAANQQQRMFSLAYAGSKYSFFLLLIVCLPIMIEAPYVLKFWLGENVPEHTVAFVRIVLLISMFDSTTSSLVTMAMAHGKIKKFQLITGSIYIIGFPLTFLALRLTNQPESVFLTYLFVLLTTIGVSIVLLRKMVALSLRNYLYNVYARAVPVLLLAPVVPLLLKSQLATLHPALTFLLTSLCAFISTSLLILGIGMTAQERTFVLSKLHFRRETTTQA